MSFPSCRGPGVGPGLIRIERGMKITEFVIQSVPRVAWREFAELDATERGEGGSGSMGTM